MRSKPERDLIKLINKSLRNDMYDNWEKEQGSTNTWVNKRNKHVKLDVHNGYVKYTGFGASFRIPKRTLYLIKRNVKNARAISERKWQREAMTKMLGMSNDEGER